MPTKFGGTSILRYFPLWLLIGYGLVGLVVFLSLTPKPPEVVSFDGADKVAHLLAYSVLMGWFGQLYTLSKQLLISAVIFTAMGVTLEILQGLGGVRFFDYADMMANTTGVLIGWWLTCGWFAGGLLWFERLTAKSMA